MSNGKNKSIRGWFSLSINNVFIGIILGLFLVSIGISIFLAYSLHKVQGNKELKMENVETARIEIESISIEISTPGNYCLARDFDTNEIAIVINSDNVNIDLNGHKIKGPGTPETDTIGIFWDRHSHISVKNGLIAGFLYGIHGTSAYDGAKVNPAGATSDITLENLFLLNNTLRGVRVAAAKVNVKNNLVQSTGGTTIMDDAFSMGIEILRLECLIEGNWVIETYPTGTGESVAICLSEHINRCTVKENYIANKDIPFPGRSFAFWITVTPAEDVFVVNNFAQGFTYPFKIPSMDNSKVIARNVFSEMECSIDDYPDYYQQYPYISLNQFISEVPGCASDDPATFLPLAEQGDPLAMFRLGVIAKSKHELCETQIWWERAASLGHKEALRQLDLNHAIFEKAGCDTN